MVSEINEKDYQEIINLGTKINPNFKKLFHIDNLNKNETIYKYVYNNQIVGFIHILKNFETIELLNIIIKKQHRRKGFAKTLINYVLQNSRADNILLEVRENNQEAINFYKCMDFIEINRRKKYYQNEDAIIMERKIK